MATNMHPFHHLFPRKSPSHMPLDPIPIWSGVCGRATGIMGWTEMRQKLSFELQMQQSNQPSIQWLTAPSVCRKSSSRTSVILHGSARSSLCPSRTRVSGLHSKCTLLYIETISVNIDNWKQFYFSLKNLGALELCSDCPNRNGKIPF